MTNFLKPKYFICDYCGEKKLISNGMKLKNGKLQCPDCKNVYNFKQFSKESERHKKSVVLNTAETGRY